MVSTRNVGTSAHIVACARPECLEEIDIGDPESRSRGVTTKNRADRMYLVGGGAVQGDAAGGALAEAVHGIIAHGVVARVEAHGVETLKIRRELREAMKASQHREIFFFRRMRTGHDREEGRVRTRHDCSLEFGGR